MKKFYLALLLSLILHSAFSQVSDSRITIDTTYRQALYFQSAMDESDTKEAIESYFDSLNIDREKGKGFILKKSPGYLLFKRAKVDYVNDNIDCYFVVNERKLKNGDASDIYLVVTKNGTFLSPDDKSDWDKVKQYATYLQQNFFKQFQLNTLLMDTQKDMDKKNKKLADVNKQKLELETGITKDSSLISNLQSQLLELRAKKE